MQDFANTSKEVRKGADQAKCIPSKYIPTCMHRVNSTHLKFWTYGKEGGLSCFMDPSGMKEMTIVWVSSIQCNNKTVHSKLLWDTTV